MITWPKTGREVKYPGVAFVICTMRDADLAVRQQLVERGELFDGYHPAMEAIHGANATRLADIIDRIGYPTVSKVGEEGSAAAWLVIQHAIGHPDFQRRCRKLLGKAVAEGEANAVDLAYLTDRIAVFEGRAQRYGTQFDWDADGRMSPRPYDDAEDVDSRRAELGLLPLAEQTERMRETARREGERPPDNPEQRRKDYDAWRRRVGWIE